MNGGILRALARSYFPSNSASDAYQVWHDYGVRLIWLTDSDAQLIGLSNKGYLFSLPNSQSAEIIQIMWCVTEAKMYFRYRQASQANGLTPWTCMPFGEFPTLQSLALASASDYPFKMYETGNEDLKGIQVYDKDNTLRYSLVFKSGHLYFSSKNASGTAIVSETQIK